MNYGKIVCLKFDGNVYFLSNIEVAKFRLKNVWGEYVYPTSITYGANDHEVYLHFTDINTFGANKLECLGTIKMGGDGIPFSPFEMDIFLDNLAPCDNSYLGLLSIEVLGTLAIGFDGNAYLDGYVELGTMAMVGRIGSLPDGNAYLDGYVELGTISVAGQYCDADGIPI